MHERPARTHSSTCLTALSLALGIWLIPAAAAAYVTDSRSHTPSSYDTFSPPAKGATYTDPAFGTDVRRLSDALKSPNNADGGNLTYAMNEYSTISAFNRDRSKLLLQHDSYFGLYDGSGKYLRDLPWAVHASSEPRWSRTEAGVLYFVNGNQLKRHDVSTGATSVVRTFGEYGQISGKGEADIGFDGDRIVLAGDGRQVFVYDLETDTKGPVLDTGSLGFDSLYITPDGNVTVTWFESGTGRNRGIELYDRNMVFQRQLTRAGGHMDLTRDTDGQEVLVWANSADPAPICDNGVVKVRLSDAKQTCLLSLDWNLAIHVSAPDGDGTAIVSTYAPGDPDPDLSWPPYTNEILRVRLDGGGTERLAHHRSRPYNGYNYMSRATVSRDGERLLFSSNFGRQVIDDAPTEYSDAYLVGLSASGTGDGDGGGGGDTGGGTGDDGGGSETGGEWSRFEESSGSVSFSGDWHDNATSGHSGGAARLSMEPGSRVRFDFTGTGVRWIGYQDEWSGIARVYLDGKLVETVDSSRSPSAAQRILYSVEGLAAKAHSLTIEATGNPGSDSTASWVWVDAFEAASGTGGATGGGGDDGGGGDGDGGGQTAMPCVPTDTSMCLGDGGRFRIQVAWEDYKGKKGVGKVVPGGSQDSGLFWFFSPKNWEMLVKVVDGCSTNQHHWVFAAATTDVAYTVTVTDTTNGATKKYRNALGSPAPAVTDTTAFATCG